MPSLEPVRATFVLSVALTVALGTARPDRSDTTPTRVNVLATGAGGGADGCVKLAEPLALPERPLSSEKPTLTLIDVIDEVAPVESLMLMLPDGALAPAARRIGGAGSALAFPVPTPKRMVVTVADARPLVSVIVKETR
ncbi:MAG: hypothetical protein Q8T13_19915 [Acidobacteriota bacterium]|nr:hypothetical protein [Acidobacteriota bacterium]